MVDRNRKALQLTNGALLCSTPWTQVSVAGEVVCPLKGQPGQSTPCTCTVLQGTTLPIPSIACLLACSVVLHGAMFAFNAAVVRILRLGGTGEDSRHIRRAVVLCASQKTLPVAATVLHHMSGVLGSAVGLAVIPCVVSHMTQIVVDSMIVSQWIKQDVRCRTARR